MPCVILMLLLAVAAHGVTPAEAQAALGAKHLASGDADAAVAALERAVELDPTNSARHHQLGDAYGLAAQKAGAFGRIGWAKKSRAAYEKAVELDPRNIAARQSLMTFYQMAPGMMGGGMAKAYAQAAEIKKYDPARGRVARAILYIHEKKGDRHSARAAYQASLAVNPRFPQTIEALRKLAAG